MRSRLLSLLIFLFPFLSAFPRIVSIGEEGIKVDYFKSRVSDGGIDFTDRLDAMDSLIKYAENKERYRLYQDKAYLLYENGDYTGAMHEYKRLREELPADSLRLRLWASVEIGIMNFTLSNFRGALEEAYNMLDTPKPDSLRYLNLYAYFLLYDFYSTAKNYKYAKKYIDQGLKELQEITPCAYFPVMEKERFSGVFYRCYADYFLELGNPDAAYSELKKSEKYRSLPDGEMSGYITYGSIARQKGEDSMAEDYFQKALDVETGNFNKTFALLKYIELLLDNGRENDALNLALRYPGLIDKLNGSPLEQQYLRQASRYYSIKGDKTKEVEMLRRIIDAKDSLNAAMMSWEAKEFVDHYENRKIESLICGLQRENRMRMWLVLAVSLAAAMTATLALGLWRRHRRLRKNAEAMDSQMADKDSRHMEEMRETAEALTIRNQQLSSMAMHTATLNEAIDNIRRIADNKSEPMDERLSHIASILKKLSLQDNIWEIFRTYFESVNQSFFNNLYNRHPDLTNGEVRMCAFIFMGFSNKEIASMTSRSVRTVEVVKRNIRKKMGITEPTESYLRRLSLSVPEESG